MTNSLNISIILIILALGYSGAESTPTTFAEDEFDEFLAVIDINRIREIALVHLQNDTNFQAAIKYFLTSEWQKLVDDVRNTKEWGDFKRILIDVGIDITAAIDYATLRLRKLNMSNFTIKARPSLRNFLDDVKESLPTVQMLTWMNGRVEDDSYFHQIYEQLSTDEAHILFEKARATIAMKKLFVRLEDLDIKVNDLLKMSYIMLGWKLRKDMM